MQPHFFFTALLGLWLELKFIQKHYSSKSVLQKQLWLEMDSDIILNKPDLNT